jgi:hypothetical protein
LTHPHFLVFIAASFVAFIPLLWFVLRKRPRRPRGSLVLGVAFVVVVVGMVFAKLGANAGWPWWIYYGLPAAVTILLPPIVFRMRLGEAGLYVVLASLVAPAIHAAFSFALGWNEYMPFWRVPYWRDLV